MTKNTARTSKEIYLSIAVDKLIEKFLQDCKKGK